jgi:hypothetical protein
MKRNSLSISSMFVVLAFASVLIPHQVHADDTPATIISPPNSSVLSGASQTFTWTDAGASLYQIWAGTSQGAHNIGSYPPAGTTDTSTAVTGLPINGSTIYIRLRSKFGSTWYFNDYTYSSTQPISGTIAVSSLPTPVSIQLPPSTYVTQTAGNYINAGSPSLTTDSKYSFDRCRVGIRNDNAQGLTVNVQIYDPVSKYIFDTFSFSGPGQHTTYVDLPGGGIAISTDAPIFVYAIICR